MVSADYIQQGLVQRGLPAHIAQGFVMNMRDESGLNPGINERAPLVQGSRGGYGLYQLTGPRRRAYESYASSRGVAFDNADAQLDFLMSELQGPEKRAAQSIFSTDNPQDAAVAIARDFLRPAASNLQKRVASYTGNKDPQATASTQGTAPMMQQEEETPRGLLGGLGIQKMQEGAPGETGQRFYERDSFKDTAALLAQGFGRMGIMGMEEIADGIAKQRTEAKAKNKTIEMLGKMGTPRAVSAIEYIKAGGSATDALKMAFEKPDEITPSSTIGKLQSDLSSGLITQEQYEVALANMAPKGMRIESDGRGGFTMVQGVGVDGEDGRMKPSDPSFMLQAIDGILNDPALDTSTGLMSPLQNVPGTPQYRFGTRARQLQGQAFLQAFESLKGGGQITEIEGQKAEAAIGRLDTAQGPDDYRNALMELRGVIEAAQKRAVSTQPAVGGVIEYDATGKRIQN